MLGGYLVTELSDNIVCENLDPFLTEVGLVAFSGTFQYLGGTAVGANPTNFAAGQQYAMLGYTAVPPLVHGVCFSKLGGIVPALNLNDSAEWAPQA